MKRSCIWGVLASLWLSGCGQASKSPFPEFPQLSAHHLKTLQEIRDYQPVGGAQSRRECLGRLVFDAPNNLEWALSPDPEDIPEAMQFPDGVPGARGERFRYKQLNIRVSYPLPPKWIQQRKNEFREKGKLDPCRESRDCRVRSYVGGGNIL